MSGTDTQEPGARSRTRRAILSAAAAVLARERTATLADIAKAADVGRSTLHRYFPDRDELVKAVIEDSFEVLYESLTAAALEDGEPREAMRRLVGALVDVGDRLQFLFGDPRTLEGYESGAPGAGPQPAIELIERGQAEGVFDAEVSASWIEHTLWALVYTAGEDAANGKLPRHAITSTVIRTFENGILR
jgi:AcrR family transcriptional regulator